MYFLYNQRYQFIIALFLLASIRFAYAGAGHGEPEPVMPTVSTPRLVITTSHFELVGILQESKTQMLIYLDDYATNTPIEQAMLELEFDGRQLKATEQVDGTYQVDWQDPLNIGEYPVLAIVIAQDHSDLLTALFVIPPTETTTAEQSIMQPNEKARQWLQTNGFTMMVSGGIIFFTVLLIALWRDWKTRERNQPQ